MVAGIATIAEIGLTVALLISELAFDAGSLEDATSEPLRRSRLFSGQSH